MSLVPLLLLAFSLARDAAAQVQKPVMGYNSYNQLSCSPTDATISAAINSLSSKGFVAAGYQYFQIDCGWASRDDTRNSTNGAIKINTSAFPNGLLSLANLARSKGMQWTMYSDAGVRMCDPQSPSPVAGSLGHEAADAAFFASLGTVYLKYDNCYADGATAGDNAPKATRTDFPTRYGAMWNALVANNIHSMLICQWGVPYQASSGLEGPNQWTQGISTSFRLSDDMQDSWSSVYRILNQAIHIAASGLIRPGHHADADLLEVGNSGMTITEQATHFAAWAMLKSALMISTNVPNLSSAAQAILLNSGLIAINQDDLGTPITLVQRYTNNYDVWMGNLTNGDKAVLVIDLSNTARTLTLNLPTLGLASATVANLWTSTTTTAAGTYASSVQAHGSLALRLSNVKAASPSSQSINYIAASSGTVSGGASVSSCTGCINGKRVGNVGGSSGGTLTLSGISAAQASQTVQFDYINGDVGYMGATNERLASISVNGGAGQTVSFPLSGYNWDTDVTRGYKVDLTGFKVGGGNTIAISGVSGGYAPDFDRIGIATGQGSSSSATSGTTTPTTSASSTSASTTPSSGCTVALYGQCGGTGWAGCTTCASGSTCTVGNPYYSQCLS